MFSNIVSAIRERTNRSREPQPNQEDECGQGEAAKQPDMHEDMELYESEAGLSISDDSASDMMPPLDYLQRAVYTGPTASGGRSWQAVQCGLSLSCTSSLTSLTSRDGTS